MNSGKYRQEKQLHTPVIAQVLFSTSCLWNLRCTIIQIYENLSSLAGFILLGAGRDTWATSAIKKRANELSIPYLALLRKRHVLLWSAAMTHKEHQTLILLPGESISCPKECCSLCCGCYSTDGRKSTLN